MTNLIDYRRSAVTIWIDEHSPAIPAYVHATENWNGFAVVLFTREDLLANRAALEKLFGERMSEDDVVLDFDANDGLPIITDPEHGAQYVQRVEVDGVTLYDIGSYAFTWDEVEGHSLGIYPDESALDHDVEMLMRDEIIATLSERGVDQRIVERAVARWVAAESTEKPLDADIDPDGLMAACSRCGELIDYCKCPPVEERAPHVPVAPWRAVRYVPEESVGRDAAGMPLGASEIVDRDGTVHLIRETRPNVWECATHA